MFGTIFCRTEMVELLHLDFFFLEPQNPVVFSLDFLSLASFKKLATFNSATLETDITVENDAARISFVK